MSRDLFAMVVTSPGLAPRFSLPLTALRVSVEGSGTTHDAPGTGPT